MATVPDSNHLTQRGADSNQMRFSLSSTFRSARSFRHTRRTSRARPSTCAGVQTGREAEEMEPESLSPIVIRKGGSTPG